MSKVQFHIGCQYSRKDIQDILGVPEGKRKGDWMTGYHRHENDWFLFVNLGIPGRDGHDYDDHFEGKDLVWYGKTTSRLKQPSIQSMINISRDGTGRVLVFVRRKDRAPFVFVGEARCKDFFDEMPVRIIWELLGNDEK